MKTLNSLQVNVKLYFVQNQNRILRTFKYLFPTFGNKESGNKDHTK